MPESLVIECISLVEDRIKHHLKSTINELYIKYRRSGFSKYEGNLTASNYVSSYLSKEFSDKNFSITALELYALCPIKYFLQRILNLPDEQEVDEVFSPMERGALIHDILFRFFSELKKLKGQQEPWQHPELLTLFTRELLAEFEYDSIDWALEQEQLLGGPEHTGVWQVFLNLEEDAITENGFVPEHFEFSFGLKKDAVKSDSNSIESPLLLKQGNKKVTLSGKIDRIDIDQKQRAIIIDYKTGKGQSASVKDMLEGISLQLPVYMIAVKQLFKKYTPVAGIYYQVRDAEYCNRVPAVTNADEVPGILKKGNGRLPNNVYPIQLHELLESTKKHIFDIVQDMQGGNFAFTRFPEHEKCRSYCPYRRMCRKDVAKLKALSNKQQA
jgi:ATP-dependent helicase/DNAse subunit B